MRKGLAYRIWAFFTIYAFRYKKPGFLPRTPFLPPMSRTTFYVRWHRILKSVVLIQGGRGGVPAQKFGLFVTAGGPTAASFADRLLAHTQQAFAHTFKKQKIRDFQISTTTNPMH